MNTAATAHNYGAVFRALSKYVGLTEFKLEAARIQDRGPGPHDAHVQQSAIPGHDPLHEREQLLGTGDVNDFQVRHGIEGSVVVVAHVGGAVGSRLKIWRSSQNGEVEAVSLGKPAVTRPHRFQTLLVPHRDAAQHLPIDKRTERADPSVVAEDGEGFAMFIMLASATPVLRARFWSTAPTPL